MSRRLLALALLAALPGAASAGAYVFAGSANGLDVIAHPAGYTGAGGPFTLSVCYDTANFPAGVTEQQFANVIQKAVATWNAQRVEVENIGLSNANDIPPSGLDLESVMLHELGHCLGLAHPNHASESGLSEPSANGTKSEVGTNAVFDQAVGVDGLHGSRDDVRGDDVNLYWYQRNVNSPLAFPATIDTTTFARTGFLPGGHLFAANGDRNVLAALGTPSTESVMQQGQFTDEAQRRLTGEDMATIRLGQSGLDGVQGTADDYTFQLNFIGAAPSCDIRARFNPPTGFASCSISGTFLSATHARITSATLNFSPTVAWFYSPGANTTTTIVADAPDPSATGVPYTVSVQVTKGTAEPLGFPSGTVEVRDDLGASCTITLMGIAAETGSCMMNSATGTRTLTARYRGFRGFDASTSATVTHVVGAGGGLDPIFSNGFE